MKTAPRSAGFKAFWPRMAHMLLAAALLPSLALFARGAETFPLRSYPSGPVTLLVGAPAGHQPDYLFRLLAEKAQKSGSRQVILRQIPGRGGMYALRDIAALPPDGLALAACSLPETALQKLLPNIPFDPAGITPVAILASVPVALWTPHNSRVRDLEDLLRLARRGPEQVRIAGPARGSDAHIAARLFDRAAGVHTLYLPFAGTAEALGALDASGAVAVWGYALKESTMPGMRPLAVAAPERSPALPQVPTFAERGLDVAVIRRIGLCMPRGKNAVSAQAAAFFIALAAEPATSEELTASGYSPDTAGLEETAKRMTKAEEWCKAFLDEYPLREEMR